MNPSRCNNAFSLDFTLLFELHHAPLIKWRTFIGKKMLGCGLADYISILQ